MQPVLAELCKRAGEGDLRAKYAEVLLMGQGDILGALRSSLGPGQDQDATARLLNTIRATENDFTVCPGVVTQRRRLSPPADVLFLKRNFAVLDRVNIALTLYTTDGSASNSGTVRQAVALKVNIMEMREVQAAVGCVGWAMWDLGAWRAPNVHCSKWNLRDEPGMSIADESRAPARKPRLLPPIVAPVTAAAGAALGLAGYFVYQDGRSKRQAIIDAAERMAPFDEHNGNFSTLERVGGGMLVTGGVLLVGGVGLYLLDRGRATAVSPAIGALSTRARADGMELSWRF